MAKTNNEPRPIQEIIAEIFREKKESQQKTLIEYFELLEEKIGKLPTPKNQGGK